MPRYVRLAASPATAPGVESAVDWEQWLGPAARVARTGASLIGDPDVTSATGGATGLLSLAQGVASGNPIQATSGALQAGNAASGYFGGPTVGSGLSSLASAAGVAPSTLSSISTGLSGAALPLALTYLAAGTDTHGDDFFDSLFGNSRDRMREYKQAQQDLGPAWNKRLAGAGTLANMDEYDTPEEIAAAFGTANTGVRAVEFSPAYELITRGQGMKDPGLHDNPKPFVAGRPMPELEAAAPGVTGANWAAWTQLADKAESAGVDWKTLAGGNKQTVPVTDYQRQGINIAGGDNFDLGGTNAPLTWEADGDPNITTQEAYDLSQAIYGRLQHEGRPIDGPLPGARGAGGYLAPDQLEEFGLTPGNYEQGITDYIAQMDTLAPWEDPFKKRRNGLINLNDVGGDAPGGEAGLF